MLETAIQDGPRDQYRTVGPPRRQKSHDVTDARQINDLVAITDGPLLTTVLKSASPLEKSRWSLWFARVELIFWRVERTTADKSTIDADDKAVSRTVKPRHGIYHILTIPVRLVGQKIEPNVCLVLGTQLEEKGMSTQDRVASRNEANPRYCRRYAREYGVLPFDAWNPDRIDARNPIEQHHILRLIRLLSMMTWPRRYSFMERIMYDVWFRINADR